MAGNTYLAYRVRPTYIPGSAEQQSLDRYRMGIDAGEQEPEHQAGEGQPHDDTKHGTQA